MNKQELIEKYKRLEGVWNAPGAETARQIFLLDLYQLDEPEKVKVPQFVADWYEEHKDNLEFNIFDYVYQFDQNAGFDFKDWFDGFNTKPIQTLVNMHQFGYEVEKEPKYTVKVKAINCTTKYLVFGEISGSWFFAEGRYGNVLTKFTRKELEEAGFGWVFDCPGVQIEEVID